MNPTLKRYLVSSIVTFVATFLGTISLQLSGGLPVEITAPVILGILGIALRAAVKVVIESLVASFSNMPKLNG